jgi:hypothetical protein
MMDEIEMKIREALSAKTATEAPVAALASVK